MAIPNQNRTQSQIWQWQGEFDMAKKPSLLKDIIVLTKFRINALAVFTGYAAIVLQGDFAHDWTTIWTVMLALLFTGGAANTLNQIFERDKDALMKRTAHKRPLPSGRMSVSFAVSLVLIQFVAAMFILLYMHQSWLGAVFSIVTILYYSFFYTLYLKPRHHLNVVYGGVPGAMGPLIAWAAVSGNEVSWPAVGLFMLIFLWTPPHAWALAIKLKEDYAKAGIPMLPVAKGVDETTKQIFLYTAVMVAFSLALPFLLPVFQVGWAYPTFAVLGGAIFIAWTWRLWRRRPVIPTMPIFAYSLVYIAALFAGVVVDGL